MQRIDGFIDIGEILNIDSQDILYFEQLLKILKEHNKVKVVKVYDACQLVFSFKWNGEDYFFKYDSKFSPFNELVFDEICSDLNIECINYDLAIIGNFKGLISKSFVKKEAKIITGETILGDYYKDPDVQKMIQKDISADLSLFCFNTFQDIWPALDYRYRNRVDKEQVVQYLMENLVKMFLVDSLVGQVDRHEENWQVLECSNGDVKFHPLFDNIRILSMHFPPLSESSFKVTSYKEYFLAENLREFIKISSQEFIDELANMLWVIKEDNLENIFERISKKIQYPMPNWLKEYYLMLLGNYCDYIEEMVENKTVKR